jgi:arginase
MPRYTIINCPTPLGLWPSGVQLLGRTLLTHGLDVRLGANRVIDVLPATYIRKKDPITGYLNGPAIRKQSRLIRDQVTEVWFNGRVPVLLGGDCSIVIGAMLALCNHPGSGLLYIDGHDDFYDGTDPSHSGEVADMGLAIVTGKAHPQLSNIDGLGPYIASENAIAFGYRDTDEVESSGGSDFQSATVYKLGLARLAEIGVQAGIDEALRHVANAHRCWIHFDTDVIDDRLNPAVDYRLPGGLDWTDVADAIRAVRKSGKLAGLSVSIFNPRLDHDGRIALALVDCIVDGLRG